MKSVKTTLYINGEATDVTLTEDQVSDILKKSQDVTDRIKTIEDAYEDLGLDIDEERPYSDPQTPRQAYLNACSDERVLTEALNEGIDPMEQEYGYIPVFRRHNHSSGFGLSRVAYGWSYSVSYVGSHRAFVKKEVAEYAAVQFKSMYSIIHKK